MMVCGGSKREEGRDAVGREHSEQRMDGRWERIGERGMSG